MDTFTTSAGLIAVTQAQAPDVDAMVAMLNDAGAGLAAKGIDQWEPGRFSREGSAAAIKRGEVYVASLGGKGGEIVGTLRLQWTDDLFWGTQADDAGYVHALCVKYAYAGHQIGLGLLRWAENQAAKAGRKFLRLDCMAANPALRNYYLKAGFTFVDEWQKNGWSAALFEREATLIEERPT